MSFLLVGPLPLHPKKQENNTRNAPCPSPRDPVPVSVHPFGSLFHCASFVLINKSSSSFLLLAAVALTQTAKKTRNHKSSFIEDVRQALDEHDSLYLFSYENMRSSKFKDVRMHFREGDNKSSSRIFLGKNKLLQIALGRTPEEEYGDNLRHVAKRTTGSVGLLLTSRSGTDVEEYFQNGGCAQADFARAGSTAPRRVVLTNQQIETHPVSMVDQFRKLGLPVEIQNGRVRLVGGRTEHVLCKEGEILSAEKCKTLVHFGIPLSEFRVQLVCRWTSATGEFEMLNEMHE